MDDPAPVWVDHPTTRASVADSCTTAFAALGPESELCQYQDSAPSAVTLIAKASLAALSLSGFVMHFPVMRYVPSLA